MILHKRRWFQFTRNLTIKSQFGLCCTAANSLYFSEWISCWCIGSPEGKAAVAPACSVPSGGELLPQFQLAAEIQEGLETPQTDMLSTDSCLTWRHHTPDTWLMILCSCDTGALEPACSVVPGETQQEHWLPPWTQTSPLPRSVVYLPSRWKTVVCHTAPWGGNNNNNSSQWSGALSTLSR